MASMLVLVGLVCWAVACGGGATDAAFNWSTSDMSVASVDDAGLVALYEATDGPNWAKKDNWLTDAPLGDWFGVRTASRGASSVWLSVANGTVRRSNGYVTG
ncbi:MAG: hypothetical protein J4G12_10205 [Gemmatimonadetes bacterium]|nr:hypothetical protein [Gemmatimonadota bacterium]